ncbi:MAG: hypothetical protein APF82_11170 [Sphingomonadales bacterium BRH_c42]|nr:MAG: hypothetical protein APF82_11170 [Sphingomonadales bacterium BRH_c42]
MIRKITFAIAAASVAFLAVPAAAQEAEEPRTTYRIEYLKLKPGSEQRWIELGEKYYGPATDAAGQKHPAIHWLMSGPWDIMMVFELPRGMAMLDSHNPPERTAWEAAFQKVAGSKEAAEKLMAETSTIETDTMVVYSHTHP